MSKKWQVSAERGATVVINAVNLSKPDYEPIEMPVRPEETQNESQHNSDVTVMGSLLAKSGIALAAIGTAVELLPESAETVSRIGIASGLGSAAIGALIVGYDRISG